MLQEARLFKDFANIEERAQTMINAHLRDPWTFHYTQQGSRVVAKLIKDELHQNLHGVSLKILCLLLVNLYANL